MSRRRKDVRAAFREAVLCGATKGLVAHHIEDRHNFADGGYTPDNGASLCPAGHLAALRGQVAAEHLRFMRGEVAQMRRTYELQFVVHMTLEIEEDAIARVVEDTDNWSADFYNFAKGESGPEKIAEKRLEGALTMLGTCLGLHSMELSNLDGWSDMADDDAKAKMTVELGHWVRTK